MDLKYSLIYSSVYFGVGLSKLNCFILRIKVASSTALEYIYPESTFGFL